MKKKIFLYLMLLVVMLPLNVFAQDMAAQNQPYCPLGPEVTADLSGALKILKIAGPVLVIVYTAYEVLVAVTKGDAHAELKKVFERLKKRLLYVIILFFLPTLVSQFMEIIDVWDANGTCNFNMSETEENQGNGSTPITTNLDCNNRSLSTCKQNNLCTIYQGTCVRICSTYGLSTCPSNCAVINGQCADKPASNTGTGGGNNTGSGGGNNTGTGGGNNTGSGGGNNTGTGGGNNTGTGGGNNTGTGGGNNTGTGGDNTSGNPTEDAESGNLHLIKAANSGSNLDYIVYTPTGASSSTPIVFFLHGNGEVGKTMEQAIGRYDYLTKLQSGEWSPNAIIVSPVARTKSYWKYEVSSIKAMVNEVTAQYGGNQGNMYISGASAGCDAITKIATQISFKGAIYMAGYMDDYGRYTVDQFLDLWAGKKVYYYRDNLAGGGYGYKADFVSAVQSKAASKNVYFEWVDLDWNHSIGLVDATFMPSSFNDKNGRPCRNGLNKLIS